MHRSVAISLNNRCTDTPTWCLCLASITAPSATLSSEQHINVAVKTFLSSWSAVLRPEVCLLSVEMLQSKYFFPPGVPC